MATSTANPVDALAARVAATTPRTLAAVIALVAPVIVVAVLAFGLTIAGAIALYFVVWWTLLFAILPFAARPRPGDDPTPVPGADPGAPAVPRLREKVLWTTLWSDLVFLAAAAAFPLAGL